MENAVTNFFQPLLDSLSMYLPSLIGAILVLIIGLLLAKGAAALVQKGLAALGLNKRVNKHSDQAFDAEKIIGKLLYYVLAIIVLMVTLGLLGVRHALLPLENMVNAFLTFLPNVVAAGIIGFAGYILAKIASELVGMVAQSLQAISERFGFTGSFSLDNVLKKIVFIFVFVPILIVALDALNMSVIADPATVMLTDIMAAIPQVLAGAIILVVFYLIARFLTPLVTEILKKLGVDQWPAKIGLQAVFGANTSLSKIIGNVLFFFIMFFGVISALEKMAMHNIAELLSRLLELSGQIAFGLVIVAIGNFLANLAYRVLNSASEGGSFIAMVARYTVIGLFIAIALNTMGIATEIVNLAFGLTLGAAAVAVALSFGLGGREAAGKQMEYILEKFRKDAPKKDPVPPRDSPSDTRSEGGPDPNPPTPPLH